MWVYILGFSICSIVIVFHGSRLAKYGDTIAEFSGMGKAWFGLIFLSLVTTLPEIISGIASVVWLKAPDFALGNALGSGAYNLLLLAILDLFIPGRPLSSLVQKSHILSGAFSILLVLGVTASLIYAESIPMLGWISLSSPAIIVLYLISIFILYKAEQANKIPDVLNPRSEEDQKKYSQAIKSYLFHSIMVIIGALLLPWFADYLALLSGLGRTFIGTLLIAATTSLPELVVSITSVRMKSYDLAVGNIFGANVFNMLLISIEDILYLPDSLFKSADSSHILTGLIVIAMTVVASIGILTGVPGKKFSLGWDAIALLLLYLSLGYFLYLTALAV